MPISILVIGCGSIGERHVRCFQKTGQATVSACDANPELLQTVSERYQVKAFPDWEKAIREPAIDAVLIATPAHLHVSMAREVLKAGKHVFIEKPLSVTTDGVEELMQLRDTQKRVAQVAYTYRSIPTTLALKTFLQENDFGTIQAVTFDGGQHFPTFRPAYREIYYTDHTKGGGAIQDGLTHLINTVEWLVGPIQSLVCDAQHQVLEGVEVEDTVNLVARTQTALCNFSFNQFQAPNETTLTLHAAGGSARAEFHRTRWGQLPLGSKDWSWTDLPPAERDSLYIRQAEAFIREIKGEKTQLATLEEGLQTLRVNQAALQSVKTRQWINIQ